MGSRRYCYFTPWQADIGAALQTLREAEFRAGRYSAAMLAAVPPKSMYEIKFPPDSQSPAPSSAHTSIQAVLDDVTEEGTRSILDLMRIAEQPQICAASPLTEAELRACFGTTEPSRTQVEALVGTRDSAVMQRAAALYEEVGRGEGRYVVIYDSGKPSEIFFIGYSFD